MKVKFFQAAHGLSLEQIINDWAAADDVNIVDTSLSVNAGGAFALVTYHNTVKPVVPTKNRKGIEVLKI